MPDQRGGFIFSNDADVRKHGEDIAELKGELRQISERVSETDKDLRQLLYYLLGTWVTVVVAALALYFKSAPSATPTTTASPSPSREEVKNPAPPK